GGVNRARTNFASTKVSRCEARYSRSGSTTCWRAPSPRINRQGSAAALLQRFICHRKAARRWTPRKPRAVFLPWLSILKRANGGVDAGERHHATIKSTKQVEKQAIEPRVQRFVGRRSHEEEPFGAKY